MANQVSKAGRFNKQPRTDVNFISETPSQNRSKDKARVDELIVYLSNAYENARARQVTEWEQMRRYNTHSPI